MAYIIQRIPYTVLDRPWGLQEMEAPKISRQPNHECGKVISAVHQDIHLALTCVSSNVDNSAMVRLEVLR
jgi:hypothetical protein